MKPERRAVYAVEDAGVEMFAVHDEEADVVADDRCPTVKPHDEKATLRVEAEAGEAAVEGVSA